MLSANFIYWAVLAILILEYAAGAVLDHLNVKASACPIPDVLRGLYDDKEYRKQQSYLAANTRFGRIETGASTALEVCLFAAGIYGWLAGVVASWSGSPVVQTFLFICILMLYSVIIGVPFSWYRTFRIEERFGFNRTTRKTFASDSVKEILLSTVLAGGLMSGLCAIYCLVPDTFWILGFAALALFSFILNFFYSDIIAPIFNKQTPLPEGELRDAITSFAEKAGFKIGNIYVKDGSKRSTHANAYFTGFGRKKRIVLYDTLIEKLTTDETVAVLAHEMGHYRMGHIWKDMLEGLVETLVMMCLLGLMLPSDTLAQATGADSASFFLNFYVFTMLWTPVNFITGTVSNLISRRHERQADAFACSHGLGDDLASGLKKLTADSLGNLTPHPAVVFFTYSHPTLAERVMACSDSQDNYSSDQIEESFPDPISK